MLALPVLSIFILVNAISELIMYADNSLANSNVTLVWINGFAFLISPSISFFCHFFSFPFAWISGSLHAYQSSTRYPICKKLGSIQGFLLLKGRFFLCVCVSFPWFLFLSARSRELGQRLLCCVLRQSGWLSYRCNKNKLELNGYFGLATYSRCASALAHCQPRYAPAPPQPSEESSG